MGLPKLTLFATLARYVIIGVDPGALPSAPFVVTTAYMSSESSGVVTNTLTNVQAGDMILVYHNAWDYTKPVLSISDTNSNTYTSQFPTVELDSVNLDMPCAVWMAIANSSNANLVITSSQSNSYQVMTSVLVRGFDSSSKFDDGGTHPYIYQTVGVNTLNILTPETTSSHNLQLTGWMWYYSAGIMRFDRHSTPVAGINDGSDANRVYVTSRTLTSQGKYYPTVSRNSGPGGSLAGFTLTIRGLNGLTPVTPITKHTELNNFTISSNMSLSAYSAAWSGGTISLFEINSGGLRIVPSYENSVGTLTWTSDLLTATNQRIIINYSDSANAELIYLRICVDGTDSYLLQIMNNSIIVKKNDAGISNAWDAYSWNPSFSNFPQLTVNSASVPTTAILEIVNGELNVIVNGIEIYSVVDSMPLTTGTVSLAIVKETTKINSIKLEKWEP